MNFEGYERQGQAAYTSLAVTIAAILTAAIGVEGEYRLQQVNKRAKQPSSLRKKLHQRGIEATTTLEKDIKDLAGCRIIFYTNSDVTRFINSGIIEQNFEVIEVKLHHPRREAEDAADLYISNHYLVALRPERIALPEYACFTDMKCEIQIQTILNHAWAEMAHDTIYKAPTLDNFGGRSFDGIKNRLQKVARKYLLPAGYEFQKIAHDFQRLTEGKALFDSNALEAIVEAVDNNVRAEVLETFTENVLPLYDDLPAVYSEIIARLVVAADRARTTPPTVIETPYGTLPAKTYADIAEAIGNILTHYRYLDVEITFSALRTLYGWAASEDERRPFLKLGKALAKHQLDVWRQRGPVVQASLVKSIEVISEDERRGLATLLIAMLGEMLGTEVSGTTSSSSTVTFHRGSVVESNVLRVVRTKAIELLKCQFALAESDEERREVLLALQAATYPSEASYSSALARLVMDDTRTVVSFQAEIASTLSLELLQATEARVHRCYRMYAELPETMRDDQSLLAARAQLESAALAFRDVVNANTDFVIYKTLVGFDSVYLPAWRDKEFHYKEAETYRAKQIDALLASVDEASADVWFERISRYARTKSNDAATFPVFGKFLERLAEAQPAIVLSYIDRLQGPLGNFLPGMLAGVMRSAERAQALVRIDGWLVTGKHVGCIAWYLRFADPFDESLLRRAFDSAIKHSDGHAVRNALIAAVDQFIAHPGTLIEGVFLPALHCLAAAQDFSWVRMPWFSWLDNPIIRALDEQQASIVLEALVPYPNLEYGAEYISAVIAERWPALVIRFIGRRQAFALTDAAPLAYDAVPFAVHQLQSPLAAAPDLMLVGAREWFEADPYHFPYGGGKLLASVFPDMENGLGTRLLALIANGSQEDLTFALNVLSAFEGKSCVYEFVHTIVAVLDPNSRLLDKARSVLRESGVISGVFGFARLHAERKTLLDPWLADPSETVRTFAAEQIRELDQWIAAETRSAEALIAQRKLDHGEELDGDEANAQ